MGVFKALIDFVMKLLGMKSEPAGLPAPKETANASASMSDAPPAPDAEDNAAFDIAGFNPETDEDAFFEAMLYIESEGMVAPNVTIGEADRERAMKEYGI